MKDPISTVLLVVDMLKGFLEPGHNLYCGDDALKIIPNVVSLLEKQSAAGTKIFFINDNHAPNDLEFQMFPVHCVTGTEETDVIDELQKYTTNTNMINKNRYSGFFNTDLEIQLTHIKPAKLIICGVCTDICVLHTASDARNRDYPVEVPIDCVATFDPYAHKWALLHMEQILGVKLFESNREGDFR